jgi:TonB family protein
VEGAQPANHASESVRIVAGLLPPIPRSEPPPGKASLRVAKASRLRAQPSAMDGEGISEKRTAGETPSETNAVRADAVEPNTHAEAEPANDTQQVQEKAAWAEELPALNVSPRFPVDSSAGGPTLSATIREPTQPGGQVLRAELISRRDPVYPPEAKRRKISGTVEVHFKIDTNGKVHDVTAVQGEPLLAQAAIQAVRGWRYKPERLDGVPTEVQATTVVLFKLN